MLILKQLRSKKSINQIDLAKAVGVSLRTIQLYERKRANIPIKNLTKIAAYFGVGIADLYSQEGVGESGSIYEKRAISDDKSHSIAKLAPGKYLVTVPLVISKHQNDYIKEHNNEAFIKSMPSIGFVIEQVAMAHYVAFEIINSSMDDGTRNGLPVNSIVLGKLIVHGKIYGMLQENPEMLWIIVHKDSIMCKQILSYDKKGKAIICHSLKPSPEYGDFEIQMGDVLQFFSILKRQAS